MAKWAAPGFNMLFLFIVVATSAGSCKGCLEAERDALLAFKAGIQDPYHRLSSWHLQVEDCCRWSGVVCDNNTQHVVELNLQASDDDVTTWLSGDLLSPSLLSLTHLDRLNLSGNIFLQDQLPEFIGSFEKLRYLVLSYTGFGGAIPPQLGNLSTLLHLDLSQHSYPPPRADSLDWLADLPSLRYLDLSGVNLSAVSGSGKWLPAISMLPSLQALHLHRCSLGNISPSSSLLSYDLNNLSTSLATLDLGGNEFNSTLPDWLWQLSSLSSLQLFGGMGQFHGKIPSGIGNLTRLRQLDLSSNSLSGHLPAELGNLTSLAQLHLDENLLSGLIPAEIGKLASLAQLDLNSNLFYTPLPVEITNLTRLELLDLSFNFLGVPLPLEIGNLVGLSQLRLVNCSLAGPIPAELWNLTNLIELYLEKNFLSRLPVMGIGKLSNLKTLDLSFNSLEGKISELHFVNLTKLETLSLSGNSMINMAIDNNKWVPPFQLRTILLNSCKMGPRFPGWLRHQHSILEIDLSNTDIMDAVPDWFWNSSSSSTIKGVDLSHNKIIGTLPPSMESMAELLILNLGSNLLEGPISGPISNMPPKLAALDLSHNSFSGPLPSIFYPLQLTMLILSHNYITGTLPSSICYSRYYVFDVSNNQISGEIPQCWQWFMLSYLILGNNNHSGEIPSSIGNLGMLKSLYLNNNKLYGHLPSSLQNCSRLDILDLSENKFTGDIPPWIGHSLQNLHVLALRSNRFSGSIPPNLGQLGHLQVIDLANNNLSGIIPQSFGNLSAIITTSMVIFGDMGLTSGNIVIGEWGIDNVSLVTKGEEFSFSSILHLVKSIDLSNNHLTGDIPDGLGSLLGLQNLNLSRNSLTGEIPDTIGGMRSLETLDLSFNNLSGEIPQALSSLSALSHLNLSFNNLSGRIPLGNQLQTLDDASIYSGNAYLCGALINKSCFDETSYSAFEDEYRQVLQILSVYVGGGLGFLTGLWSVFIVLLSKKDWRHFYFRKIDLLYDKIYVAIRTRMNRFMVKQGR